MYLSKVKLFGFKSFAKKTDIVFDEGITAIVGPNGCGKSNVVDAIRWVLGEQRVSSLRSDKMESVIFSGSDSKKPLGMAEVSLLIENTKNILPTEYSEVEVKRRIYRSGESEYLLNNVPCKLKDIITLFMDTGMGSDAYSLIELPMIEQIISDKTEDRRRLFEEASGITKYKKRRNEAFRRLEDTRQDLLRVNDIIIEVERKVNSLKRQAAKVRRYQKLKDELKIKEHELLKSTLYSIKLKNEPLASNINQLKNCQGTAKGELIKKEADLEKLKSDLVVHENSLSGVQTEYNSIVDILNSQQMELALSKEKNHSIHEQIKKIESEEKELTRKISDNLLALKENKEKLAILERNVNDITDEQKQAEEKLSGFYVEYYDKKNRLSTAQTKIVELIEKYSEEGRKQDKMLLDLRQKEEKLSSMVKESTFIKERLSNKESILKSLLTERKRIENFLDEKRKYCSKMEGEVEAKRIMLSELKEKKMDFTKQVEIDSKKIDFLYQIISEAGKLSEGTEHLLKEKDSIVGLLGTVGELIKTDEKYEKALLGSLQSISNFLIFDTADNGFKALKMLAERASGEVDIIPLDKISKLDAPPKVNLDDS
ncbi:AAA family ATPase, partial [bacterium]|nr:AAA family ATPase [bacterium]